MISQRSSLNSTSSEWMWLCGDGSSYVDMHCAITITSTADVTRFARGHSTWRERLRSLHQTAAIFNRINGRVTEGGRRCRSNAISQSHHGISLLLILGQEFCVCLSIRGFDVVHIKVLYFIHVCFEHLRG